MTSTTKGDREGAAATGISLETNQRAEVGDGLRISGRWVVARMTSSRATRTLRVSLSFLQLAALSAAVSALLLVAPPAAVCLCYYYSLLDCFPCAKEVVRSYYSLLCEIFPALASFLLGLSNRVRCSTYHAKSP